MISGCKFGEFGQIGSDSALRKEQDYGTRTHSPTADIQGGLALSGKESVKLCGVHESRNPTSIASLSDQDGSAHKAFDYEP